MGAIPFTFCIPLVMMAHTCNKQVLFPHTQPYSMNLLPRLPIVSCRLPSHAPRPEMEEDGGWRLNCQSEAHLRPCSVLKVSCNNRITSDRNPHPKSWGAVRCSRLIALPSGKSVWTTLSRNQLPVLRPNSIITEGRTIRAWQHCRYCTGRGQTSCTFRFSTAVAKLPPQQLPEHLTKRTVFDLLSRGIGGEPILSPFRALLSASIIPSYSQSPGPRRDRTAT